MSELLPVKNLDAVFKQEAHSFFDSGLDEHENELNVPLFHPASYV